MSRLIDRKAYRLFNAHMDVVATAQADFKKAYDLYEAGEINEIKLNRVGQKSMRIMNHYMRRARLIVKAYSNIQYIPNNNIAGILSEAEDQFFCMGDFLTGCKVLKF